MACRGFIDRADEIIVMVDSSKFDGPSGHVVCPLQEIAHCHHRFRDCPARVAMLEKANVKVIIA